MMKAFFAACLVASAALVAALALPRPATAQTPDPYPSRPVRLIAPAAPGGNPDVLARMLAQKLSDAFGRPFVVENQAVGGGLNAAVAVARSSADGHTLFLGDAGAFAIQPALNPKLPYHPVKGFTFITALVAVPTVLVLHPSVAAPSLPAFIDLAKAKPGQINFGSAGNGSIHHMTLAIFATATGTEFLHVPLKGGSPLVAAILAGDVQAGFSGIPNVAQAIKAGRLRVLGISTSRRSDMLPDVPTLAEQGVRDFDVASTIGLQAPAGVLREIVARLQAVVAKAIREPDVTERIGNLGMVLMENGTEHYVQLVQKDLMRYAAAVKAANIKIE
jgi:tripartite-type tricarboxylate transporter receptor subunit TctC